MADEEHLKIIQQGVDVWNEWRKKKPEIKSDLSEVDLRGANLTGANLLSADLSGANLHKAELELAGLRKADLHRDRANQAEQEFLPPLLSTIGYDGWLLSREARSNGYIGRA